MTVIELMIKLDKMPHNAIVTMQNDSLYIDGEYEATSVETYDCNTVMICSDYKNRIGD